MSELITHVPGFESDDHQNQPSVNEGRVTEVDLSEADKARIKARTLDGENIMRAAADSIAVNKEQLVLDASEDQPEGDQPEIITNVPRAE